MVSAPSGCGKDTLLAEAFRQEPRLTRSVSATTRAPREGEVNGRDYIFMTERDFKLLIELNGLVEYTNYVGSFYGTPKAELGNLLAAKDGVVLKIETEGAARVKAMFPESVSVFIMPPSEAELERRLRSRGTDTEEKIKQRLAVAKSEMALAENYDRVVVNDDLDTAVNEFLAIFREYSS